MLKLILRMIATGIVSRAQSVVTIPAAYESARAVIGPLGRALAIRHVDAGSCNACELEIQALNNALYNLEGLGIHFVASPRHADVLLVTGPVTRHMVSALRDAYEALPDPKIVIALGDCAEGLGPYPPNYATVGRVADVIPVDITLSGCPPSPTAIWAALAALIAK